jgi:hypothetical protein
VESWRATGPSYQPGQKTWGKANSGKYSELEGSGVEDKNGRKCYCRSTDERAESGDRLACPKPHEIGMAPEASKMSSQHKVIREAVGEQLELRQRKPFAGECRR